MEEGVEGPRLATRQHLLSSSLQKPLIEKPSAKSSEIEKKQNKILDINYNISEAIFTNTCKFIRHLRQENKELFLYIH